MHHITTEMRQCVQECQNCQATCLETLHHCLEQGGPHAEPAHVTLMLDCAEICRTSADFLLRGSELHTRFAGFARRCVTAAPRTASAWGTR